MSVGLKDRELQEYYEALFAMYGTPGWQKLMEDVGGMIAKRDTVRDVPDAEKLHVRQGELSILDWLKNHQAIVEYAYSEMLKEEGAEEPNVQTGGVAKVIDANVKDE